MKYTQIASDAFELMQLNAGILTTDFDPSDGSIDTSKILGATGGGVAFEATTVFVDMGEGVDNVPPNTKELKQIDHREAKMSGTFKTMDTALAKSMVAGATVTGNKVVPRSTLIDDDFDDMWWVGDYSDVNTGATAGYIAIRMINALSTGGFKIQSNDKNKGDFAFEYTAHYSLSDTSQEPFEIYIKKGVASV